MGSPTGVGNARVLGKQLLLLGLVQHVVDLFPEGFDTADLLENPDIFRGFTFDGQTWQSEVVLGGREGRKTAGPTHLPSHIHGTRAVGDRR